MDQMTESEKARFDSKVNRGRQCWTWNGPLDRDGYGSFYLRRRNRRAHRVAWFASTGEAIPAGLVVNHTCGNRACVNPQHLNLMTPRENALRDSRSFGYINSQKTKCPQGHPFDLVVQSRGRSARGCSICEREKHRRLKAKWRAEDTLNV